MNSVHIALVSGLALALAGCGGADSDADTAATPTPDATPSAAAAQTVAYTCDPAKSLTVTYDTSSPDGGALVTLDGTDYAMDHVPSGSGAKYEILPGITAGKNLIWWTQGEEGMLMEGTPGDETSETTIATCNSAAPPAAAAG